MLSSYFKKDQIPYEDTQNLLIGFQDKSES